nr:primosomal protein N' [Candidatus Pandoraea novymonadis]
MVRVALDTPLPTLFDYRTEQSVTPGQLVQVPFRRRQIVGIAWELAQKSKVKPDRLRAISTVLVEMPALSEEWRNLIAFAANYYHRGIGEVALQALPGHLRTPTRWARLFSLSSIQCYRLVEGAAVSLRDNVPIRLRAQRRLAMELIESGVLDAQKARTLCSKASEVIKQWVAGGWVTIETVTLNSAESTFNVLNSSTNNDYAKHIAQIKVANIYKDASLTADVKSTSSSSDEKTLTVCQAHAVSTIAKAIDTRLENSPFTPFILHGVTGSGKTEVYLRTVAKVLQEHKAQVLILVPEINLTPQLECVFRARFPREVLVILHSALAEGDRAQNWLSAHRGKARIVLGTRLSVLASMPYLRLIIVDEEHDPSYKQQEGLRYSARDLAIWRGSHLKVPVILGSATPSLDSWKHAKKGRYICMTMPERGSPDAVLPTVSLIDLEIEKKRQRIVVQEGLSQQLLDAVRDRLKCGEQSLLYLNRRGYAPVLACDACGWVNDCSRCSAHLVLHKLERCLRCHHCGIESRIPNTCPNCGNLDLAPLGRGTQRIEEALSKHFPNARLARIDADSTRRKGSAQGLFEKVHAGHVDILIGTQMITKGHDFRNVTLVGVLNADAALFSHDFRAAERLFAQLMQVAGRAGRAARADSPGDVLIQTRYADHPLFNALIRHDYEGFANQQLEERRQASLPPYTHQALLRAESKKLAQAMDFLKIARTMAKISELADPLLSLWDPVPMSMVRISGIERAQLVIESPSRTALQSFLSVWIVKLRSLRSPVRWHIEVDPLEI